MCGDCGCSEGNKDYFVEDKTMHVTLDVLQKNKDIAHDNWHWFDDRQILPLNLMSSPGSGKTLLLEKTFSHFKDELKMMALIGDQQTDRDAIRIQKAGGLAKQITTNSACHLDALMVQNNLSDIDEETKLLFIENVGNLVCPSAFDLGEKKKVALLSTTEGEDKPLKYPVLFYKADVIIITKTDLIPYLDWDEDFCLQCIRKVNPKAIIIKLSAKSETGMQAWYDYLESVCV